MTSSKQVLDSPEVARLVKTLEYVRWTGRPGYPVRAMVGLCLVKRLYALPMWSRTAARSDSRPTARGRTRARLAGRDVPLGQCIEDVTAGLKTQHPEMGRDIAIDASDMPAYANGRRTYWNENDPDFAPADKNASWG